MITQKTNLILSLCELIVGGKEGLKPVEKTAIDLLYSSDLSTVLPKSGT